MIAVDTNVFVRFLTRDDERQFEEAERCFRARGVFVPDTVLLETVWVLTSAYSFDTPAIVNAIKKLLGLGSVVLRDPEGLTMALAPDPDPQRVAGSGDLQLGMLPQRVHHGVRQQRLGPEAGTRSRTTAAKTWEVNWIATDARLRDGFAR